MAPIRRYLRITKYSVLECRIYLDNPALAHSWLLNPRDPILPRVIESVRPLVLPKIREERERSRKKSTKKRGIKDVVVEDDFEVSIFLTETNTRHSLLFKHKHFRDTTQTKLTSNSTKLTGASREAAINVDDQAQTALEAPLLLREEDDDNDVIALHNIPTADEGGTTAPTEFSSETRPAKRRRGRGSTLQDDDYTEVPNPDEEDNDLFVSDEQSDGSVGAPPPAKRHKDADNTEHDEGQRDDKKKLAMDISYEGFSIYGRVLCLVVKKRGGGTTTGKNPSATSRSKAGHSAAPGGQAVMENWITSTQIPDAVSDEVLNAS
ncbi:hypothetical protein VP1G_09168 [Cytospora mali]|uniref:Uncharacterized protein n=1 Tax=Cytospora mali TaxID=578113 RepID=A0A194VDF7_CYTMA|nr:hypothetical protein VP1G_09168 [Valsa mali var. pyri (nom. inval.)]